MKDLVIIILLFSLIIEYVLSLNNNTINKDNNHYNIQRRKLAVSNGGFEADAASYTSSDPPLYTYPSNWGGFGISLIKYTDSSWLPPSATGSGSFLAALQSVLGTMTQTVSVPANSNFAIQFAFCRRPNYGYVPNVNVYCNAPGNAGIHYSQNLISQ